MNTEIDNKQIQDTKNDPVELPKKRGRKPKPKEPGEIDPPIKIKKPRLTLEEARERQRLASLRCYYIKTYGADAERVYNMNQASHAIGKIKF